MSGSILDALHVATILGSGIVGGVFFAFSTFIMRALSRSPSAEGIRVMQQINVTVLNPGFLGAFLGTAVTSLMIVALEFTGPVETGSVLRAVGSGAYLFGTFGVTIACNVPRNDALARLDPEDPKSVEPWKAYLRTWTFWNHVRTAAALGAMGALIAAGGA